MCNVDEENIIMMVMMKMKKNIMLMVMIMMKKNIMLMVMVTVVEAPTSSSGFSSGQLRARSSCCSRNPAKIKMMTRTMTMTMTKMMTMIMMKKAMVVAMLVVVVMPMSIDEVAPAST